MNTFFVLVIVIIVIYSILLFVQFRNYDIQKKHFFNQYPKAKKHDRHKKRDN